MPNVSFNNETLVSLSTIEYSSQWENIALNQLFPDEQELISGFLILAKGDSETEINEKVLLVKTNEDRMLEQVYGASLFRESENGDGLVMKMGANVFPVAITSGRACVQIGYLKGSFLWLSKKRADGSPYTVLTVSVYDGRPEGNHDITYEIGCSLATREEIYNDPKTGMMAANPLFLTPPKLDRLLDDNAALGQFFTVAKSGSGSIFKLKEMQPHSEWRILAAEQGDPHPEYGISYIFRLEGGASAFASGKSKEFCKKQLKYLQDSLKSGEIWSLKIGTIEEYAPGKTKVNHALVKRAPSLNGSAPKPIQQARPQLAAASTQQTVHKQFGADYGSAEEGIQWALAQGLSETLANQARENVNQIAEKKKRDGEPMTAPQRRLAFMAFVKELAANQAQTTIDVEATEPEVDNIPF